MAVAAAAVIAAGGTAGVMQFVARDPDTTVAEAPVDPGPLYVLPGDSDEWAPGNGHRSSGMNLQRAGIVVGIEVDGVFLDPVAVNVDTEAPPSFDPETWRALSIQGGEAFRSPEDAPLRMVVQRRGRFWLSTMRDDQMISSVFTAFEAIEIGAAGALIVTSSSDLSVIASYDIGGMGGHGTYAELAGPAGELVVVETTSGEIPAVALLAHGLLISSSSTSTGPPAGMHRAGTSTASGTPSRWEFAPLQTVFMDSHLLPFEDPHRPRRGPRGGRRGDVDGGDRGGLIRLTQRDVRIRQVMVKPS